MNGKKSGTRQPPITEGAAEASSGRALTLPTAMNGKASPTKAADGDAPVFAYLASLPQPQRDIAEAIDALAARTLPNLHRSVKWEWRTTEWATDGASARAASPATSS